MDEKYWHETSLPVVVNLFICSKRLRWSENKFRKIGCFFDAADPKSVSHLLAVVFHIENRKSGTLNRSDYANEEKLLYLKIKIWAMHNNSGLNRLDVFFVEERGGGQPRKFQTPAYPFSLYSNPLTYEYYMPGRPAKKRIKKTADSEAGIKVESVGVIYSPETRKVLDKNSCWNLRLGVSWINYTF